MIGKTLNDFIETLNYGFDMEFLYNERTFFIEGYTESEKYFIELNEFQLDAEYINNGFVTMIFEGVSFNDCVIKLLNSKLIDGKTLFELEKDITVLFG